MKRVVDVGKIMIAIEKQQGKLQLQQSAVLKMGIPTKDPMWREKKKYVNSIQQIEFEIWHN